ncbi:hypothetical protein PsorP6_001390 [Peronosclerospora sorghi]|uniref:Uncharacterized protein n=1 Tax=Peronosclerospora sorghi TaxID=230839 RepID=A0ACC0WWJ9_9STRA|nr:hypothetical protein PsorP6_001390 [Peronosclerospora sorghi]
MVICEFDRVLWVDIVTHSAESAAQKIISTLELLPRRLVKLVKLEEKRELERQCLHIRQLQTR